MTQSSVRTHVSDTRALRRYALAVLLPIGPLCVAGVRLLLPYGSSDDPQTQIAAVTADPAAQNTVLWLSTAAVLAVIFLVWTQFHGGSVITVILAAVAALAFAGALAALYAKREGWSFTLSAVAIGVAVISLFAVLYPNVLPSTINPAYSLTVENAAATPKTLGIMTWVAVIFLPLVLIYQGWTYWVFRRRIGVRDIPA